jgi:hypothetical protein
MPLHIGAQAETWFIVLPSLCFLYIPRCMSSIKLSNHSFDTAQRFHPDMLQPLRSSTVQIFRSFIQKLPCSFQKTVLPIIFNHE